MRPEKQYLVEEVRKHLSKSDYLFVANYEKITVAETSELRKALSAHDAEFHVVKNSILAVAAKESNYPNLDSILAGQNAIIIGGKNPSEVAKAVEKFAKVKDKVKFKGGVLNGDFITAQTVSTLASLPSFDQLRAQLLSLFSTPASQMARLLDAKAKKDSGETAAA